MKKIKIILSRAVLLSFLFISCSTDEDGIYEEISNIEDIAISYTVMEYQIFSLINEHRTNMGLEELGIINYVSNEAEVHTDYMITEGVPSHDNFSIRYKNLVNKLHVKSVGENVAYGYSSAEAVVRAWIKSPAHRRNIENESYTDFGISTKQNSEGRNYFTHIFINR